MRGVILIVLIVGCSSPSDPEPEQKNNEIEIGDSYKGGTVFQRTKMTIFIAAKQDIQPIQLTCYDPDKPSSNQSANGYLNTRSLYRNCTLPETGVYKAWTMASEGYDDWFVPSIALLKEMYRTKDQNNINLSGKYWSSSCGDIDLEDQCMQYFITVDFSNGEREFNIIHTKFPIRPIRIDTLQ